MTKLTEKEILQDVLLCEKFMLSMYDQFSKEASCMPLLDICLDNMEEIFGLQHEIFLAMKEKQYYPVTDAEKQKIDETIKMLKENKKDYSKDFE